MSAKDLILDFLNLFFILLLIAFCIIYFIAGNHFSAFYLFLESMAPLAFFGIIFLVKIKITRSEIKRRKSHGNTELVLDLNIFHKLASDMVVFGAPILLGLLIYKARGRLDAIDIIFLIMVFLIMFFWQRYIFSKER